MGPSFPRRRRTSHPGVRVRFPRVAHSAAPESGLQGYEVPAFAGTTKGLSPAREPRIQMFGGSLFPCVKRRSAAPDAGGATRFAPSREGSRDRTTIHGLRRRSSGVVDSAHELQSPASPASRVSTCSLAGQAERSTSALPRTSSGASGNTNPVWQKAYASIQHLLARVVRTTRNHGERHQPREGNQEVESGLESAPDRGAQSLLARPLQRHLLIPLAEPPSFSRRQGTSYPRDA